MDPYDIEVEEEVACSQESPVDKLSHFLFRIGLQHREAHIKPIFNPMFSLQEWIAFGSDFLAGF